MGLKGKSGLIYDENGNFVMHINAPYDSNGKIFAIIEHDEYGPTWERMSQHKANKRGLGIINCCQCCKPATQIDHHWPHMSGMNLCDEHEYDPEMYG